MGGGFSRAKQLFIFVTLTVFFARPLHAVSSFDGVVRLIYWDDFQNPARSRSAFVLEGPSGTFELEGVTEAFEIPVGAKVRVVGEPEGGRIPIGPDAGYVVVLVTGRETPA